MPINWPELIIGAILGTFFSALFYLLISLVKLFTNFLVNRRPIIKLFGSFSKRDTIVKIFIRDFFLSEDSKLLGYENSVGLGQVSNIHHLWSDSDSSALAYLLNVLGQAGKSDNILLRKRSDDRGEWKGNIILIGGHSGKSNSFFQHMKKVAYSMDNGKIYDHENKEVMREDTYGYGIILKSQNPYSQNSPAFFIGGFGSLGTIAAAYYLKEKYPEMGKRYGNNYFGVLVRCSVKAGMEAVEFVDDFIFK